MKHIQEIVEPEIKLVEDDRIRDALLAAYAESASYLRGIENCLADITGRPWPAPAMRRFFNTWRRPTVAALSFCAVTCRLLEEASARDAGAQRDLFLSAARIAEVSNEDTGLSGPPHGELYQRMATAFCGNDAWKLDRYGLPAVTEHMTGLCEGRERALDMTSTLMVSLADELYSYGEFNVIAPLFERWHGRIAGLDGGARDHHLEFVFVHVGAVESGHFAAMTEGLVHYCRAHGTVPDGDALGRRTRDYLRGTAVSYDRLLAAMEASTKAPRVGDAVL